MAPELRVIDEQEKNLGVMTREAALNLAKEKGLDLIEVSALAKPPVARIIAFDKFRYQYEKKLKQQRLKQKGSELKRVQISARAALHDLEIKTKKIEEFLGEGDTVKIILVLRGREKANKDWARGKFEEFIKMIKTEYQVISPIKPGMRGFMMKITKK